MPTHRPSGRPPSGRRLRSALAAATLTLAAATAGVTAAVALPAPAYANPHTYGQDVSGYEADHDWINSRAQFGFIKATEGTSWVDSSFPRHWGELDKKGIVRGVYHYGHPSNDPIAEADHFLKVVNSQPSKPGDILVLDLEDANGQSVEHVNEWARTWLEYVTAKTGTKPMFYSGWNFADKYGRGLGDYPLWVAHYSKAPGDITPPADWKTWTIHQYTDTPIDQNVSALTPEQLRALGRR
ncbi:glycoside hydrolase family 25 protein [Microbispora sp. H11081]|uniref:glycoside hydrolase family 25 protein n=1 Tax=Microbispora sp. H11081 TaxID=2729107 RepID=UPI00147288B3|nr:GH25 family lysozyme [Microbispora sp. H11081]